LERGNWVGERYSGSVSFCSGRVLQLRVASLRLTDGRGARLLKNIMTGLLLFALAAMAVGCGPAQPEEFSFHADRQRIAGLRLWDDEPRGPRPVEEWPTPR
jgi:hypothetical protein